MDEVLSLCDGYYPSCLSTEGKNEYFFDQNPENFNSILDIYRTGKLHRTLSTCALTYTRYLEYWGFDELHLDSCCAIEYYAQKDCGEKETEGERIAMEIKQRKLKDEEFGNSYCGKMRTFFWNLTEYPDRSFAARVRNFIVIFIVSNCTKPIFLLRRSFLVISHIYKLNEL